MKKRRAEVEDVAHDEMDVVDEERRALKQKKKKKGADGKEATEKELAKVQEKLQAAFADRDMKTVAELVEKEHVLKERLAKVVTDELADAEEVDSETLHRKRKKESTAEPDPEVEDVPANCIPKRKKKTELVTEPIVEPEDVGAENTPKKKKKRKQELSDADAVEHEDISTSAPPPPDAATDDMVVCIAQLPWAVDEDVLQKDFSECGEIVDIRLLKERDTGESRGIAFITFKDETGVKAALAYDGDSYGGRTLRVNIAQGKGDKGSGKTGKGPADSPNDLEVFIKNLGSETEYEALNGHLRQCGKILRLNMPTNDSGCCKGFAWVTFKSQDGVDKALQLNGKEYGNRVLTVEASGQHKTSNVAGKGKVDNGGSEIFVKNLTFETKETDLRQFFAECGDIEKMKMPVAGAEGKSMGFAWITFKTEEGFKTALSYNDAEYNGRRLFIEKSGQHKGKGNGKDKGKKAKDGKGKGKSKERESSASKATLAPADPPRFRVPIIR